MRVRKFSRKLPALALMLLSACGLVRCAPDPVGEDTIRALYDRPLAPPGNTPPNDASPSVQFTGGIERTPPKALPSSVVSG